MINKTILRVGSALSIALAVAGCNNDSITNLNKNPNSPEDVPPGPLFTEASRLSTSRWFGGIDLRTYEWIVQHLSEVQYNDEDRYLRVHAADTEGSFNGAYAGELKDLTQIIAKGQATNEPGVATSEDGVPRMGRPSVTAGPAALFVTAPSAFWTA